MKETGKVENTSKAILRETKEYRTEGRAKERLGTDRGRREERIC